MRSLLSVVLLVALVIPVVISQSSVFPQPTPALREPPTPITKATVSAELPLEVVDGSGTPVPVEVSVLPLQFFDDFSWRSFIALNWPAKIAVRGTPDPNKELGDAGPRVWETWKSAYEIYQPQPKLPTEWRSFRAVTPCTEVPEKDSGKTRIFGSFSAFGFGDFHQAEFGAGAMHDGVVGVIQENLLWPDEFVMERRSRIHVRKSEC